MQQLFDLLAAVTVAMLVAAGLVAVTLMLWVRAQRRRARRRVERTLDRLAEQVASRLAAGDAPGWALERYRRLTDDARQARTWGALQRLVWRERLLDEALGVVQSASTRRDALRRYRRTDRRAPHAPR